MLRAEAVVTRNVMRLRIQRGYTQQRLAQELGITHPRIAQIESASANLQIDTLDRLAAVFGVEPARLLQVEKPNPSHPWEERRNRWWRRTGGVSFRGRNGTTARLSGAAPSFWMMRPSRNGS